MKNARELINKYNMFVPNSTIGVACSGGIDSMCLLHFVNSVKDDYGINVVAINVDHCIRKESAQDSKFVEDYCKKNGIKCHKFKVDVTKIASSEKLGIEESARKARYDIFYSLIEKGIVDKIAIAHHEQDQIETILLNLFRGCGLKGASGMDAVRDNLVRPFLTTKKTDILTYALTNSIPNVEDETNNNTDYSRNMLRHKIIPLIRECWENVDGNLLNFANICKQDNSYINSTISFDDVFIEDGVAQIPLYYFAFNPSIANRVIRFALEKIKCLKDVETKHLAIIKNMANEADNGVKINLPNGIVACKEYNYITITKKQTKVCPTLKFETMENVKFAEKFISIKKVDSMQLEKGKLFIDANMLPKNCIIRTRKDGDMFEKFGGGSKKLKDYFIDKKIPLRLRDEIPLIAKDNEIFAIFGYEISNKVKVNKNSIDVYELSIKK